MSLIFALIFYINSLLITSALRKKFSYPIARALSLLLLSFTSYTLAIFIPFKISFYISFVIFLVLSVYSFQLKPEKSEALFVSVYSFFLTLRYIDPTILDAEKFMNMAIINSILKANSMHPEDPFLAGFKLDCYYYFGHVISAVIILLSFSPPEIGYNVAVAAVPAYSALLFHGIARSFKFLILALFSGNLFSVLDLLDRVIFAKPIDILYYWNSTRVVAGTINEFPYFSFIHADLHAHVLAIYLKLLLFNLVLKRNNYCSYFAITITLFALFATNSWDFPLSIFFIILFSLSERDKKLFYFSVLSLLFVVPFYLSTNFPAAKLFLVEEKTDLTQFIMYSLFPITACYLTFKFHRFSLLTLPAFLISPVLALTLPLLTSALVNLKRDSREAFLITAAVSFILPEFVAVESRMNTFFKFYLFAWLSAYVYASLKKENIKNWKNIIISILLVLSLIYPLAATPVRYHEFENTLDGMNFVRMYSEYEAIKWLQDKKGVTIEEGCSKILCGYSYAGRVAVFTGNPAVIAWTNHEFSWRRNIDLLVERSVDVERFYRAETCEEMYEIVKKYNIKYIFIGVEEIKRFELENTDKFSECFNLVFEKGSAKIFLVSKN